MITLLLSSEKHWVNNYKTLLPFKSCADCVLHYQCICRWCLSTRNETKLWFEQVGTSLEYVREVYVVLNILPWKTFNVRRYNGIIIPGFYWFSRTLSSNLIKNFLWNQPHKLNIWKTFDVNTSWYGNPYDPREGHQSSSARQISELWLRTANQACDPHWGPSVGELTAYNTPTKEPLELPLGGVWPR